MIALAAPAAFTLNAVASAQTGTNPSAGPATASRSGPGGMGGGMSGSRSLPSGAGAAGGPGGGNAVSGTAVSGTAATALAVNASRYTWIVATSSAQNAAGIELATGKSVMAIGGFTGSDNATTLARFKQLVAAGKIHYYVAGGGGPGGAGTSTGGTSSGGTSSGGTSSGGTSSGGTSSGGTSSGSAPGGGFSRTGGPGMGGGVSQTIESWVTSHFKSTTVGGMTVYDLTQRTS